MEKSATYQLKNRPELLHPENREKYISEIGETISLFLDILGDYDGIVNEFGERAIISMAMLNSLRRDLTDTVDLEINN